MLLPVRHHSPACARMVRDTIRRLRPAAVLIEGPADFNERIDELHLPHKPPVSIYSYVAWEDGRRQGAYHPLCEHSPEWQALQAARDCGAVARFIDLPFAVLAREDGRTHRYADDRLRASDYVEALCARLEVESFDDAWDRVAEVDPDLDAQELRHRVGDFCRCLREADGAAVSAQDLRREAYMAAHIRAAWEAFGRARVVVVTGGYHTSGLAALLAGEGGSRDTTVAWPAGITERGIALTPYSHERLDRLAGYDAGMPSPGFYHEAWRAQRATPVHVPLLGAVVHRLRELKQAASTADLIAVETCAQGLAALRGHPRVWRRDLTDGILAALVKDDLHVAHPFLSVMQEVLRGGERGRLAEGAPLPPLVRDIQQQLSAAGLSPDREAVTCELTLTAAADAQASRLLHRLRVLRIPGFERKGGVDFAARTDLSTLRERWQVVWTPDQDALMIEASRYGSALQEAAAACLAEGAEAAGRNAAGVALLLLDAVLAGVMSVADPLRARALTVLDEDGDLASVARAVDHLLYLHVWDDALGVRGSLETGVLLAAAWRRALWLLESGSPAGDARAEVDAVRLLRDAFERAGQLALDREVLAGTLARVQADAGRSPAQRGACAGALWSLRCADPDHIRRDLGFFAAPGQLGDFLTGLFSLAREEAQDDHALIAAIDAAVAGWDEGSFLTALPSLRLAFMFFTPREKVNLADALFADADAAAAAASAPVPLTVSTAQAAEAMAFEHRLHAMAATYGVTLTAAAETVEA